MCPCAETVIDSFWREAVPLPSLSFVQVLGTLLTFGGFRPDSETSFPRHTRRSRTKNERKRSVEQKQAASRRRDGALGDFSLILRR